VIIIHNEATVHSKLRYYTLHNLGPHSLSLHLDAASAAVWIINKELSVNDNARLIIVIIMIIIIPIVHGAVIMARPLREFTWFI